MTFKNEKIVTLELERLKWLRTLGVNMPSAAKLGVLHICLRYVSDPIEWRERKKSIVIRNDQNAGCAIENLTGIDDGGDCGCDG
jgi:hypothetical protein